MLVSICQFLKSEISPYCALGHGYSWRSVVTSFTLSRWNQLSRTSTRNFMLLLFLLLRKFSISLKITKIPSINGALTLSHEKRLYTKPLLLSTCLHTKLFTLSLLPTKVVFIKDELQFIIFNSNKKINTFNNILRDILSWLHGGFVAVFFVLTNLLNTSFDNSIYGDSNNNEKKNATTNVNIDTEVTVDT